MTSDAPGPGEDVPSRFHVDFTGRSLLGTYRVERRLAEGGMGSVYLAEDTSLGMRVVVKVPHARFLGEPGFRTRFRREIAELVRLEHPHVARILARGEEDGVPFFVLQYLGGGSLEDRLKAGPASPESTLGWLATIAETLDFVHARGVVHRDVKPANILFDEEGHVFLSDFGVVKALGREDAADRTEAGTGVGSPLYMSPEQGLGREVSGSADQYALAATLFEAIAGDPPFGRGTVIEVMLRKQKEAPPSIRLRRPEVPEPAALAIERALATDPAARFPLCAEFAGAFRKGLGASRAEPLPAGKVRGRLVLAVAAALVLAAGVIGVPAGWFSPAGKPATRPPAATEASERPIVVISEYGTAPRRALRLHLAAGSGHRYVTRAKEKMQQSAEGVAAGEGTTSRVQGVEVKVAAVDADGTAHLAWTLDVPRDEPGENSLAPGVLPTQADLDAVGRMTGTSILSAQGGATEVSLTASGPPSPLRERMLAATEETIRAVEVVFPEEPIGIGAQWSVTKAAQAMGIRYRQAVTYDLVALEGDVASLRYKIAVSAAAQGFTAPGVPKGMEAKMTSFHVSGGGTVVFDLSRPWPVENEMRGTTTIGMEIAGGDKKVRPIAMSSVDHESIHLTAPCVGDAPGGGGGRSAGKARQSLTGGIAAGR